MTQYSTVPEYSVAEKSQRIDQYLETGIRTSRDLTQVVADLVALLLEVELLTTTSNTIRRNLLDLVQSVSEQE